MERLDFNLTYVDDGYGITSHMQTVKIAGAPVEFEVEDLEEGDSPLANQLAANTWNWFCAHQEETKVYLARGLIRSFNQMRQAGEKHVPYESFESVRERLDTIHSFNIESDGSFTINFWLPFHEIRYRVWVSVNENFALDGADILTMGGFQPPKSETKPNLNKAQVLYYYHGEHGNEALYQHYVKLSKKEISKYIELFIADEEDISGRLDRILHLALYSYACGDTLPNELYDYLLANEIYYYGELYLRAEEWVAEKLITVLQNSRSDSLSANHLLCALSAIPCEASREFLLRSSLKPLPQWAEKLHILPVEYARVSGWQAGENGQIEKLYSEEITVFERCRKEKASVLSPVKPLTETCGYCGQPLTLIFDGDKKLATCMYCACYETVFVKQESGRVYWHPKNTPTGFLKSNPEYMQNEEEITQGFEYGIRPTKEKRRATYTAHQYVNIPRTQIGGLPTAVNDVDYPHCPDCGKTMQFVAQLDMETVEEYGEGLFYFFSCEKCNVHGANYDQT